MTLLTTVFAALISSIIWYKNEEARKLKVGTLSLMYWGASLMWFIDAVFEYVELGAEAFVPAPLDMLNDFYLGLSVLALGLIIWLIILLVRDPKGVVKAALFKKN